VITASAHALPGRIAVNIGEVLALLSLASLTLEPLLGSAAAAAFLASGALMVLSQPLHSLSSLLRWWPLLLLPVYCLLSIFWSEFPASTLRYGLQMTFTLAVAIVIANRVPAVALLRGLFLIYSLGIVLSLGVGRNSDGAAWLGIFDSKNAFAAYVAVYALICVGLVFDRDAPRWMRLAALGGALLSLPLLVRAQSAGALAMIGPAVLTILAVVWVRRLSDAQKAFAVGLALLGALTLGLVLWAYGDTLLAAFLESSGKDATLTGRTDLWRAGFSLIAERPLFGVGYRAFWIKGNGPAEQLWAMFGEPSGAGFNFHNMYISNAVELGIVGLAIEIAIIYVAAALLLVLAVVRPTHIIAFMLGLQVLLILRSFVEVEVFQEFSVRSMLTYCVFVYAVREFAAWRRDQRPASMPRLRPRAA
jgi:exopolysaccharide production protein ExoQ